MVRILTMILFAAVSSEAAVFVVNSFTDAVDVSIGNGICATAAGACTLRAAIQEANFADDADTINLPSGLFTLTIAGADEDSAATGDLDVIHTLTINGAGGAPSHINGNGTITNDRVFEIHGGDVDFNLLMITGGRVNDAGGCIRNSSNLTFQRGEISNCVASGNAAFGGAISSGASSTLVLDTLTISGCSAENAGGALSVSGMTDIYKVTFSGNSAGSAGGIRNAGTMGIDRCKFTGNSPTALLNLGNADMEFSAFYNNNATTSTGAIGNFGTLNMRNSTVSGNTSTVAEGGIYVASGSNVSLNNVTITENSGSNTGGITSDGTVSLQNTILANNLRTGGSPADCVGTIQSGGHNLIGDLSDCLVAGDETGNIYNTDPLLSALEDIGGPSPLHLLQPGSPAVDAGDDATCETTDQREIVRPKFAACDIGSVEAQTEFALHLLPDTITINTGQNAVGTVELTSYFDFNSAITLNCIGLPAGMTCSFNPSPATPPANGAINSTLTIDPGVNPEGTYVFNVVGVGGASFRSKALTLVINDSLFSDDFEDNDASDWSFSKGTWSVSGGELVGTVDRKGIALTPDFGECSQCEITAMVNINSQHATVSLLGWYRDKGNLVELKLMEDKNKVLLKQKSGGATVAKQKALTAIDAGVDYEVRIVFDQMVFTVFLNGIELFTVPTFAAPIGNAGFQVRSSTKALVSASFGEIHVQ